MFAVKYHGIIGKPTQEPRQPQTEQGEERRAPHGAGEAARPDLVGGGQREGESRPLLGLKVLPKAAESTSVLFSRSPHLNF